MTTIADLRMTLDTSQIEKGQVEVKKLGTETKSLTGEQAQLAGGLKKTVAALTDFESQTSKVTSSLKDAASSFNPMKLAAGALTGVVAALSYGALKDMVSGVIEGAASLNNLSTQTGLTVESLSVMKSVAAQSGTSMDTVTGAVIKFEKSIAAAGKETSLQSKAFRELGISTADTSKTTEQYLDEAAAKLATLSDGWQKNNITMALFGKSGTEVNEFLRDYAERGDIAAKITSKQAQDAEDYERTMRKLHATQNQYKTLVGFALLPVMKSLADEFLKVMSTTGKLDDETKKLLTNEIQEWAFAGAKGLAAAADVGIALWNVVKGIAQSVGTLAGSFASLGGIVDDIVHGRFTDANNKFLASAQALKGGLSEAWKTASADSSKYYDMVTRAQDNFNKHKDDAAEPKKAGRVAGNIGTADDKEKAQKEARDLLTPALTAQTVELSKLGAEYAKLTGQQEQSTLAAVNAGIALGKYGLNLTEVEKTQLRAGASLQDFLKKLNADTKAEFERTDAIEKADKSEQDRVRTLQSAIKETETARKILQYYGATQDDVALELNKGNIAHAERLLLMKRIAGVEDEEVAKLTNKLRALKEEREYLTDRKDANNAEAAAQEAKADAEAAYQRTFTFGWSDAFARYKDDASNAALVAKGAFEKTAQGMEDALTSFSTSGKVKFRDLTTSILQDIARVQARAAISGILGYLTTAISGYAGTLGAMANGSYNVDYSHEGMNFGGPRAGGGDVNAGMTYLVGEKGPELLRMGSNSGSIVPNHALTGGGGTTVNSYRIDVHIGSVDSDERKNELMAEIDRAIEAKTKQTLAKESRKGGMLNPVR